MSLETMAGALLLIAPVWFNVAFAVLARTFDYPDILRRQTDEVLRRFLAGPPSHHAVVGLHAFRHPASANRRAAERHHGR